MNLKHFIINIVIGICVFLATNYYHAFEFSSAEDSCIQSGYGVALVDRTGSFYCLYMNYGDLMVVEYEKGLSKRVGE